MVWRTKIDDTVVGHLDLAEAVHIDGDDIVKEGQESYKQIVIVGATNLVLKCESRDPQVTTEEVYQTWLAALRRAHASVPREFGDATNTALLM